MPETASAGPASGGPADAINHLRLTATVVQRQPLRYTPAGLPVLDVVLAHESQAVQEGQPRQVKLEIRARAIGSLVGPLQGAGIGSPQEFAGFIGPQRNGRGIVFHLQSIGATAGAH